MAGKGAPLIIGDKVHDPLASRARIIISIIVLISILIGLYTDSLIAGIILFFSLAGVYLLKLLF